jgi:hypothetical protein
MRERKLAGHTIHSPGAYVLPGLMSHLSICAASTPTCHSLTMLFCRCAVQLQLLTASGAGALKAAGTAAVLAALSDFKAGLQA